MLQLLNLEYLESMQQVKKLRIKTDGIQKQINRNKIFELSKQKYNIFEMPYITFRYRCNSRMSKCYMGSK